MKVYIAGAVSAHPDPSVVREVIQTQSPYDINIVDPMNYEVQAMSPEEIIEEDLRLIRDVDGLLMYWNPAHPTFGGVSELFYASWVREIPAVVWQTEDLNQAFDGRPNWVEGLSDDVVRDIDEAFGRLLAVGGE